MRVKKSITVAVFPVAFLFLLSFVACTGPLRCILLSSYLIYYYLCLWILAGIAYNMTFDPYHEGTKNVLNEEFISFTVSIFLVMFSSYRLLFAFPLPL